MLPSDVASWTREGAMWGIVLVISLAVLVIAVALNSSSPGGTSSGGPNEEAAIKAGLAELEKVTRWLVDNAEAAAPQVAAVQAMDPGFAFMMQARNMKLASVAGTSSRVGFEMAGLMLVGDSLARASGKPSDALTYLNGLRMLVMNFYVSEPTYRVLQVHYREFARIMHDYVTKAAQLVDGGLRITLSRIAEDLHDVDLHDIAKPLDEALEATKN